MKRFKLLETVCSDDFEDGIDEYYRDHIAEEKTKLCALYCST